LEDKQKLLEEQFLGACMIATHFQDKIRDIKKAVNYFTVKDNKEIFEIMLETDNSGHDFDLSVLTAEATKRNILISTVTRIYSKATTGVHLKYYFKAIKDAYLRRKTAGLAEYTLKSLNDSKRPANDILTELANYVTKLQETNIEGVTAHIDTAIEDAYNLMVEKMYNPGGIVGLSCGMDILDGISRGFEGGRLYAFGGRPGKGKTTLAIQAATAIAKDHKVVNFSMEMPKKELTSKVIQAMARVDMKVNTKQQKDDNVVKISAVLEDVAKRNLYINDSDYQTIESICTESRRMHRQGLCNMVIVDHATLVQLQGDKPREMLSKLGKALKGLAKELDIPVLLLCQLNRDPEKEKRRPRMSDIGESGTLEQDIDFALLLHDEDYDNPQNLFYIFCIPKNRGGETAEINVIFQKKYQIFEERQAG